MKILYATYPMAFHTPGGGEIQLLAYQKHVPAHGIEVSLFDMWNPRFLEHDAVHFFSCMGGSSHFCGFIKKLGLPLIVSSSLWITPETRHLYPMDEIRLQLGFADRIITNSEAESRMLASLFNFPLQKFSAVYNGMEERFFNKASPETFRTHIKYDGRFVLNVGNIEPRKNQLRLAQAMKSYPELKLVLIGHARDPDYLREVLEVGGTQIMYQGPLPHDSTLLASAYAACEVFVLPSTLETPGLAALEAATQNARLVLTQEGCCQEYFGEHAVYVDPLSADSIARGIGEMAKRERPSGLATEIQKFTWKNVTPKLASIYREVGRPAKTSSHS